MKVVFCYLLLLGSVAVYAQEPLKDFYLSHSLKQENEQYQFKVLDDDKRGVFFYKKDRFYYWYKAQRVLATQGGASGVLLHGEFESFYTNKQLCRKGEFRKGLKDGEWLYWREDGTLLKTERWHKGKLAGTEKYYNEKGEVIRTVEHKTWSVTDQTSDSTIVSRQGGKKQTIYHKNEEGTVFKSEEKKKGKLHGSVIIYDDAGQKIEKTRYKKGELQEPKTKDTESEENAASERKWWQVFKKKEGQENPVEQKNEKRSKKKQPDAEKKVGKEKADQKEKKEKTKTQESSSKKERRKEEKNNKK